MPIDANIALGVKPAQFDSPINMMTQVQGLQNAQQENQLRQLQIQQATQAQQDSNALRTGAQGLDLTKPEGMDQYGQLILKHKGPQAYQEYAAGRAKLDKDQRDAQAAELGLALKKAEKLSADAYGLMGKPDLTLQEVLNFADEHAAAGTMDPAAAQRAHQTLTDDPVALKGALARIWQQGLDAKAQVEAQKPTLQQQVGGDYGRTIAIKPDGSTATEVPGSRYKINESPNVAAKIAANPATAGHPLTAQAMLDGRIPLGRVNSRTAALYEEALSVDPNADLTALNNSQLGEAAGAKTAGSTQANIAIASDEARRMIGVAREFAANLDTGKYPNLNAIENAISKGTGDVNIVKLHTALNAVINSYARAINPKGTPTVSDKNHARDIVNEAMSKGQIGGAFDVMEQEMASSNAAATAGTAPKPHGAATKPTAATTSVPMTNAKGWPLHTDKNGNKAYVSPDGKQYEEVKAN